MEPQPLQSPEELADVAIARHGFEAAGLRFLISEGTYSELTNRTAICAIPDTPRCVLGFINHRGETLPIFSLERLLDPESEARGRWILLIDRGARTIGILLDSYPQRLNELTAESDIELQNEKANELTRNSSLFDRFCGATFRCENESYREFDHQRFCEYSKRNFIDPARAEI